MSMSNSWVSDAIQPSDPLSSPSPPAFNLSQHQGLFKWVSSLHQVAKYWSFSFSISPSNEYSGLISFRLPQISYFTLSLKCFSSDSDSCLTVGIRWLHQFPYPLRAGPVLLTLLFPLSYRVLHGSNTLPTWCEELTHLKSPWCWERLKAGAEGDDKGWYGWMASPTQWTWVWVNPRSWWWTRRPDVLQSMGSDMTERLNWTESNLNQYPSEILYRIWEADSKIC